jgi:hypothetical protein
LHGPWQLYLHRPSSDPAVRSALEAYGRFTAPSGLSDQLPADYRGTAVLQRSFHRPTGLDDQSQLQLRIVTNFAGPLSLNEHSLGTVTASEQVFDVTRLLQTRNQVRIEVVIDARSVISQPYCDVRLEILA